MNAKYPTQLTIRNVPQEVSARLRQLARVRRTSVNQVVLDELYERVAGPRPSAAEALKDIFGTGFDPEVARALEEDDRAQKELVRREMGL